VKIMNHLMVHYNIPYDYMIDDDLSCIEEYVNSNMKYTRSDEHHVNSFVRSLLFAKRVLMEEIYGSDREKDRLIGLRKCHNLQIFFISIPKSTSSHLRVFFL
jgi:hypothetical protein